MSRWTPRRYLVWTSTVSVTCALNSITETPTPNNLRGNVLAYDEFNWTYCDVVKSRKSFVVLCFRFDDNYINIFITRRTLLTRIPAYFIYVSEDSTVHAQLIHLFHNHETIKRIRSRRPKRTLGLIGSNAE